MSVLAVTRLNQTFCCPTTDVFALGGDANFAPPVSLSGSRTRFGSQVQSILGKLKKAVVRRVVLIIAIELSDIPQNAVQHRDGAACSMSLVRMSALA